jgi:hypothetical protein
MYADVCTGTHIYNTIQKKNKEEEMTGTCSTHRRDEKCIQYFGWIALWEETSWKI